MKALYLEPDEEITSVIDRLREIEDEEVAIIVPRRAGILQSIINLKLLRYQAERMKKRISLVTTDKTGRNLASAVGLTVYQKMPEGTEVKESAVKDPEAPVVPIKFKRRQTVVPEETQADEPTEPKPKAEPPVMETHEVADEAEPEVEEPATDEAEEVEPAEDVVAEKAVEETISPSDVAMVEGADTPDQPKQGVTAKAKRMKRAVKFSKPDLSKVKKPKVGIGKKGLVIGLIALLVLLGGGAAAATLVFPKAIVTVTPQTQSLTAEIPVTFSGRATSADTGQNVVPAKVIEVTVDAQVSSQATGSQTGGEKAQGAVVIVNQQSKNQTLVAKTRLADPAGKIYRIQDRVVVPAGGEASVNVVADDGGPDGNLPAGTRLTIPGLGGNTQITGRVDTPLTGGAAGTGAKTISAADVERAKTELAQQAAQDGLTQAKAKQAVGYKLDEQVAATTVLSSTVNPSQGSVADNFTISGPVKVSYFSYQEDALQQVLADDLAAKVPAGSELIADSVKPTFVVGQQSADRLIGVMKVDAQTTQDTSVDQLKQEVSGKSSSDATQALRASGKASNVSISFFPFWLTGIPRDLNHIEIKLVAGQSPSTSTASPVATPAAATPAAEGTAVPQI